MDRCIGFLITALTFVHDKQIFEGDDIFYYIISINCWMENEFSFTKFSFTVFQEMHIGCCVLDSVNIRAS